MLSGELRTFKSHDDVVSYLLSLDRARTLANELIAPTFTVGMVRTAGLPPTATTQQIVPTSPSPLAEGKSGSDLGAVRTPGTNVQVLGVDEPDIVKCDGKLLVIASSTKVNLVGVEGKKLLNTIVFKDEQVSGMFLYGGTLAVITTSRPTVTPLVIDLGLKCDCSVIIPSGISNTSIHLYDVSSPHNPRLRSRVSVTGSLIASRMNENYVYLITSLPIIGPTIPLVNDEPVRAESIVKVDSEPIAYTTIIALDVSSGSYSSYAFMTGYNSWLYMSLSNLYLVSSKAPSILEAYNVVIQAMIKYLPQKTASEVRDYLERADLAKCVEIISDYLSDLSYNEVRDLFVKVSDELSGRVFTESSKFYVFSVKGANVSLRGSFEVPGRVLDQFSMEEVGNYFVVATTSINSVIKVRYEQPLVIVAPLPYDNVVEITECRESKCLTRTITITKTPEPQRYKPRVYVDVVPVGDTENNVFTVNLKELKVTGSLRGLAEGERIYASRLIGNVFYLVTYRQVDPLFAIDISNPEQPKVLGYLKIPGFSEYLHPLPRNRLLGIGIEDGLKISLFDVSNPTEMREMTKILISKAWSTAYYDHHAVTVDEDNELAFIPVSIRGTSGILAITYKGDVLSVRKLLEHEGAVRTTYVNDELFTISSNLVKVYDIYELNLTHEIELNN